MPRTHSIARPGTGRPGLVAQANVKVKTLTKTQQKKKQQPNSKQKQVKPKSKASATIAVEQEEAAEQLSTYDSYYKQLAEEVETIERHVRELRQTPGLEHLTEAEAHTQVDFMLRFSAWVFNLHEQEHSITEVNSIEPEASNVSKVQKPKARVTKKVTKSLSR